MSRADASKIAKAVPDAVRLAIQQSTDSVRTIAARYGISPTTVQKWRKRHDADDRRRGPKMHDKSGISPLVARSIIMFRLRSLLPLDDCYYALSLSIPTLSRSSFHRCLQHYGLGSLAEIEGFHTAKALMDMAIGDFSISVRKIRLRRGHVFLFSAIDRVSKITFARVKSGLSTTAAIAFVRELARVYPFAHGAHTGGSKVFARSEFLAACRTLGISHKTTNFITLPLELTTSDQIDFETREEIELALTQYDSYNHSCKLKVLGGRSPAEFVAFRSGGSDKTEPLWTCSIGRRFPDH